MAFENISEMVEAAAIAFSFLSLYALQPSWSFLIPKKNPTGKIPPYVFQWDLIKV